MAVTLTLVTDSASEQLTSLYLQEHAGIARLAYLLCGDPHLADDLAHEAFANLYEHWDRVGDPTKRLAYLRASVVNLCNSVHRRRGVAARHAAAPARWMGDGVAASAEDAALDGAQRPAVMQALATLPARQRAAVVLRHWVRMTEGEIAATLGCSVGSVRTHLVRGHDALAARLGGLR